jgi:hypothetical protein
MPVMPIFLLWGILGTLDLLGKGAARSGSSLMRLGVSGIIVALTVGFWAMGAASYGRDVAYIESEMVAVAKWVNTNLPPDALIAAHDIGALGYFDHHELIDLAGLVSPEVIPFLRDESQIESYLRERGAGYLIAFPNLYPTLAGKLEVVFSSGGMFAPSQSGENLVVYRLQKR